ncbi:MAG TPA: hypothetical protein PKV71_05445 [Calditrichia bacterium]|nr:hypothetical protein [Calditrichota bacterium]HQU74599.1 hypothetical protein [Calditrichia bacterium]HQV31297.1 hypothetical protein [Calditrichia bacterium]
MKLIWFSIFSLLLGNPLATAQTEPSLQLLRLGEGLFEAGEYDAAVTEYKRFLFFEEGHPLAFYAQYQIGQAFIGLSDYQKGSGYLQSAFRNCRDPRYKPLIRYQLALAFIRGGQLDLARLTLIRQSLALSKDSQWWLANQLMLGFLQIRAHDWEGAKQTFEGLSEHATEAASGALDNLNRKLARLVRKPAVVSPRRAEMLSTFVPGLGQLYSHAWREALNASFLNALTTSWVVDLLRKPAYRDATLVILLVWSRYYLGNRLHARETAMQRNQDYIEEQLPALLNGVSELTRHIPDLTTSLRLRDLVAPTENR